MLKRILPARSCRATCRLRQTGRRGEDETGCLSKCPTVFTLRLPPPLSVGLCPSSPHANQPLATARAAQRATSRYLRGPPLGNWAIRDDRTPGFSRQPGSHALTWSFPAGSPAVQRQPTHALLQTTGSPVNPDRISGSPERLSHHPGGWTVGIRRHQQHIPAPDVTPAPRVVNVVARG